MAHKKIDRVQQATTWTGAGALGLDVVPPSRMRAFADVLSNGDQCWVLIEHQTLNEYEISLATYNSGQITRSSVLSSSTGTLVSFSAGLKAVSLIAPAGATPIVDGNGNLNVPANVLLANGRGIFCNVSNGGINIGGGTEYNDGGTIGLAGSGGGDHVRIATGANANKMWVASTGVGINTTLPHAAFECLGGGGIVVGDGDSIYTGWWGGGWTSTIRSGVQFDGANQSLNFLTADTWRGGVNANGDHHAGADNTKSSGTASYRWSVVYAGTGTINTSGADAKANIGEPSAAERAAAARIKAIGPKRYKFADAVAEKGEASARWHFGYIAEDVRDALAAEGLDPWAYGFMCSDPVFVRESYTVTKSRPRMAEYDYEETITELVDGLAVLVTKARKAKRTVGRKMPVFKDGAPVMVPTLGVDGAETLIPMLHFEPEMEEYEEEKFRMVDSGQVRLGLRYSELEAFLACAE